MTRPWFTCDPRRAWWSRLRSSHSGSELGSAHFWFRGGPITGAGGDGIGEGVVFITTAVHGEVGGPVPIVPRTFGIARGRSCGPTGRDTAGIGAIVLPIIGHPAIARQIIGRQ